MNSNLSKSVPFKKGKKSAVKITRNPVSISDSRLYTCSSLRSISLSITHLSFTCLGLHFKTKNIQQMFVARYLTMLHLKLIPTPCKHANNSQ
jgi:hypothetical protein